jgi:hypothetical protein
MTAPDTTDGDREAHDSEEQQPGERPSEDAAGDDHRPDGGDLATGQATEPDDAPDKDGLSWSAVRRNLLLAGIVVLGLLATWATFQVYASASQAIGIWLSDAYVPIFQAVFNVVVVLVALAGILALVRELS